MVTCCCASLNAQDIKLAGASYYRFGEAGVDNIPGNPKVSIDEYRFFVNVPKVLNDKKTILINGLDYSLIRPHLGGDSVAGLNEENFHIIGYRFIGIQKISEKWSAQLFLNPVLSSSLNAPLSHEDFILTGAVQVVKKVSEDFQFGFGLARNARLGEPLYLPAFFLSKKSEKSKLYVLLPNMLSYDRFYGKFTVGIKAELNGSLYRVNTTGQNPQGDDQNVEKLSYFRAVVGPRVEYALTESIHLEVAAGGTFARRTDVQVNGISTLSYNVGDSPFFQVGLFLVPPKKKAKKPVE